MALDGLVVANIASDLNELLIGGRIDKIAQPEKDEIILSIRNNGINHKLLMTVEASMPRIHLTKEQKKNPLTPPNFCMFLRKHINNGKILSVTQPDFERIIRIEISHRDELGDLESVFLIIEMMGRHSNIILTNKENVILDSIKHINAFVSSVREVLPGRDYILPPGKDKINPLSIATYDESTHKCQLSDTVESLRSRLVLSKSIHEALIKTYTGMSSLIAEEICYRSGINSSDHIESLSQEQLEKIYTELLAYTTMVYTSNYTSTVYMKDNGDYKDFSSMNIAHYNFLTKKTYRSISELLDHYYKYKSIRSRVSQKTTDIRKLIQNNIDRCKKKLSLQKKQIEDTKDKDKFKIIGELIHANLYQINEGDKKVTLFNYYTNEEQTVKLDPQKTPVQNANNYYNKYNKKKRTFAALSELIKETEKELLHLESIQYSLEFAETEEDIKDIRTELMESGYIKFRKTGKKKNNKQSDPLHYISSEGYHLYVGKNNIQNEFLSTKFSNGNDWWFHVKNIPGSHVIVKSKGEPEMPDSVYEEAAALAAYYSKGKNDTKVAVDYTQKKHLKKPNGSALGYFIYHTNYSLIAEPSISKLEQVDYNI